MGKPKRFAEYDVPSDIEPRTDNQEDLMYAIENSEQVVVLGPAGTGKSYICAGMAADWYKQNKYRKIIITRPMVPVGEEFGHLPGDLLEKTVPWALPVLSIIEERVGKGKLECDLGYSVEIVPLQLMRGRTFDNAWILADECQNLTVEQAKMLVTRVGENSKLLVNGDIAQTDIDTQSGLSWMIDTIERRNMPIPVVEFDIEDCQRSGICKMWLRAMSEEKPTWTTIAKR